MYKKSFSSYRLLTVTSIIIIFILLLLQSKEDNLPVIAIANYGAHTSLEETIMGIRNGLEDVGLIDGENIKIVEQHVNFQQSLIAQMLSNLKFSQPKVIITLSTPVALSAKNSINDIPIIYTAVTDPVEAGLVSNYNAPKSNITGISDKQDLVAIFSFAKELLGNVKSVGILYSTAEINDDALIKMANVAVKKLGMQLVAIPVEQSRDIPLKMQLFKDKVDFIYVSGGGVIQPSLPMIVLEAEKMKIPVINLNSQEVKEHKVFASYGISYYKLGINVADMVKKVLDGVEVADIVPKDPSLNDYEAMLSLKRAKAIGFSINDNLPNLVVVE